MSLDLGKEGKGFTKEEMLELSLEDLGGMELASEETPK